MGLVVGISFKGGYGVIEGFDFWFWELLGFCFIFWLIFFINWFFFCWDGLFSGFLVFFLGFLFVDLKWGCNIFLVIDDIFFVFLNFLREFGSFLYLLLVEMMWFNVVIMLFSLCCWIKGLLLIWDIILFSLFCIFLIFIDCELLEV